MTTRQIAYRLKAEGKTEVLRDARDVGEAFKGSYQAAEQGAAAATSAADKLEQKYRRMAQAAQDSAQAQAAQARINATLGVSEPVRGSAAASASVFMQDDDDVRRVEALRAAIDPLTAAQNRLNHELKEYQTLANAGKITTGELAQLQGQAKTRYDETTAAIARQEKGVTRLMMASRINLARQAPDVLVTAAMGMNPIMIAIQQLPQILDAAATSGIKVSAGMLALGGALTAAAAGVVLLGVAWQRADSAAADLTDATSGVGRTAGLTADQLRDLTVASAENGEVSRKAARDMAVEYLATGQIGKQVLGDLISLTRDFASFTNNDAKGATTELAKAMLDPTKAGEAMTAQFGLLNLEQLDNIENLQKQGDLLGAQKVLLDELTLAVSGHADRAGEITDAWNAIGRSISDAIDKLGEFLHQTEDERIDDLRRRVASPRPDSADSRREASELWVLETRQGIQNILDTGKAEEAARNQQALRDRQAQERRDREARAGARTAAAAARREAAEAERERKAALQRSRQEEDREAQLALAEATGRQDFGAVQRLEDASAVRMRERQLIDDNTAADVARNKALAEQGRLIEARRETQAREIADMGRLADLDIMREAGEARFVAARERSADITARIVEYQKKGLDLATAQNLVASEMADLDAARAESAKLAADAREREWQMTLASASGDDRRLRTLTGEDWIETRAREIEGDDANPLNRGEGRDQAAEEYGQLLRAQTVGGIREGWGEFIADVENSDSLRDAVVNQLFDAGERWLDKLLSRMGEIDWTQFFKGGSDGAGGSNLIAQGANFLFGKNAEGTDYWPGGLTWVGERGKELLDLPRGSRVVENARSLDMVRRASSSGGKTSSPMAFTYAPVITVDSENAAEIRAMLAQQEAEFRTKVVGVVKDASARFEFG
ncbi:MAG: phage tail length tape measure family protein [Brevundimonas sp.]